MQRAGTEQDWAAESESKASVKAKHEKEEREGFDVW